MQAYTKKITEIYHQRYKQGQKKKGKMEICKAQTARELQKTLQSVTKQTIFSKVTGICGAGEQNRCGGW